MSKELIKIDPSEFGIEEKTANELTLGLNQILEERNLLIKEFDIVSRLEIDEKSIPKFRDLRVRIQKNRTQGINQWHRAGKEYFLRGGQFLDAIRRKELLINENMESVLMDGEKHFENLEKDRLEKLQDYRAEMLRPYVEDANERDLCKFEDDEFDAFLNMKKKQYNDKIEEEERIEAERIAKEKAEEKERARIKAENEKLKREAQERERLLEIENNKREAENAKRVKAEKEAEAKRQAELNAEKEKHEAELKKEREKANKIAEELRLKREAEIKAEKEAEAKRQAELNKGDKSKLTDLISDLEFLKNKYTFKSEKNNQMYKSVGVLIDKVINYIEK